MAADNRYAPFQVSYLLTPTAAVVMPISPASLGTRDHENRRRVHAAEGISTRYDPVRAYRIRGMFEAGHQAAGATGERRGP